MGEMIGQGQHRGVYVHGTDASLVVKVPILRATHRTRGNRREWRVWQRIRGTEWEPYFAPCVSFDGYYLIQVRCELLLEPGRHRVPMPCRDDPKHQNFGILDGRIVCLDYANAELKLFDAPLQWTT